jgi:hypothetical protein
MADDVYRPGVQHPEEWRADLNPDAIAGPNPGLPGAHPEKAGPTANDDKEAHRLLPDFGDDDLKRIPILPEGSWLKQGATYLDLSHRDQGPFTAGANMVAGPGNRYIPKSEVDYPLWNRLAGVTDPARLDQASGA